jgi:hypothetical protein
LTKTDDSADSIGEIYGSADDVCTIGGIIVLDFCTAITSPPGSAVSCISILDDVSTSYMSMPGGADESPLVSVPYLSCR